MPHPPASSFKRIVDLLARQAAAECLRTGTAIAISTSTAVSALLPTLPIVTCGTDGGCR
jgi:hypothetical protein